MTVLLDTDVIPARERADAIQSAYRGQRPARAVELHPGQVRHRVRRIGLGAGVHLLRTGGSALTITRTARHIRADGVEFVAIGLHHHGETVVTTGGATSELAAGQLNCVDTTRPYRLAHRTANAHDVLILDMGELGVPVDVVRSAAASLAASPVYDLMLGHVTGLYAATRDLGPQERALIGASTAALTRALLTTAADAAGQAGALDDALGVRIRLYIEARLGDRNLSVADTAAAHNISVRQLYKIWERDGHDETPAEWIMRRRVRRAAEELISSDPRRVSVAAVARRHGFTSSSHFSRRFRELYGVSPRGWRAAGGR